MTPSTLVALPAARIAAHRRWGSILAFTVVRAWLAYFLVLPVLVGLVSTGLSQLPGADARLFEPGAMLLVETLRIASKSLNAALTPTLTAAAFAGALLLVALAYLMVALRYEGRLRLSSWSAAAFDCVPTFILFSGLALLAQAVVVIISALLGGVAADAVTSDGPARDIVFGTVLLLGFGVVLALGVVHDLARAARVALEADAWTAPRAALLVIRDSPLPTLLGYALPALAGVLAIAAAAGLVGAVHVDRGGAVRASLTFAIHQLGLLVFCFCRAIWLSRALALVIRFSGPAPAGRPERSAERAGPTPDPSA